MTDVVCGEVEKLSQVSKVLEETKMFVFLLMIGKLALEEREANSKRTVFWDYIVQIATKELEPINLVAHVDMPSTTEKDAIIIQLLESIVSKSDHFQDDLLLTYRRVFWQTVKETAAQVYKPTWRVMQSFFPDLFLQQLGHENLKGISSWQLHFAASLSSTYNTTIVEDFHTIINLQPEIVQSSTTTDVTPFHYAVAKENPNMAVIQMLHMACPSFVSILTDDGDTPLHLSAQYSNSVALIKQLIADYPVALTIRNRKGKTPFMCSLKNEFSEAPAILQAIIDASSKTSWAIDCPEDIGEAIHSLCMEYGTNSTKRLKTIVAAFPHAVNICDWYGDLPVFNAVQECNSEKFEIIAEANLENLLLHSTDADGMNTGTVAHRSVYRNAYSILDYIGSTKPQLLYSVDESHQTPLAYIVEDYISEIYIFSWINWITEIAPEAVQMVDIDSNNLLHSLANGLIIERDPDDYYNPPSLEPCSDFMDTMRLFIRLIPGGVLATNNEGQTPYDMLNPEDPKLFFARRRCCWPVHRHCIQRCGFR